MATFPWKAALPISECRSIPSPPSILGSSGFRSAGIETITDEATTRCDEVHGKVWAGFGCCVGYRGSSEWNAAA